MAADRNRLKTEITLGSWERFDNYSSANSRPIETLRSATNGIGPIRRIDLPRNAWVAMMSHPDVTETFKTYRDEPAIRIALGKFVFEWRGLRRPGLLDIVCDLLVVPRGVINVLSRDGVDVRIHGRDGAAVLKQVVSG
jgi:hypothetical protein